MESMTSKTTQNNLILFDSATCSNQKGVTFDVWYTKQHLAALREVTGASPMTCYASASCNSLSSIIELNNSVDLDKAIKIRAQGESPATHIERFVAEPIGAQYRPEISDPSQLGLQCALSYPVFFAVPDNRAQEFNRWYDQEHLEILLRSPYWLACRRFKLRTPHPNGYTHLALHYLSNISALNSPERDEARRTPWRDRLATESWFRGEYRVYHRIANLD
jgi:hypothetical protein